MRAKAQAASPEGETRYVLGFDGGGTKSICVIAREDGEVVGTGLSGESNFQGVGIVHAGKQVKAAIAAAIAQARIKPEQIATAAYGVAGADREADFDTVASYVLPSNPAGRMILANDTTIALRAGTRDGIGVALICGTGSNCIGFNADKEEAKVGGMGELSGDMGFGEDLVRRAIVACMKARDGRAKPTLLTDALCGALGIAFIEDIITFFYADHFQPPNLKELAPLVFECAAKGDRAALGILDEVGRYMGKNALVACRRLFKKEDKIPIVLGGSILQKSKPPVLEQHIRKALEKPFPNARVIRLKDEPVLGAVFFALDLLHRTAGAQRMALVRKTYPKFAAR
jgi:N-acetylglucosamine kinase-like BadF-type ATPase